MRRRILIAGVVTAVLLCGCIFRSRIRSEDSRPQATAIEPAFRLSDPGTEPVVEYARYGEFRDSGAFEYRYVIKDIAGLARAQGAGIFPNRAITADPLYKQLRQAGKLAGSAWEHVASNDPAADFYSWATARDMDPGVQLYFTGLALQQAGLYQHAVKAYRAAMVLFPKSTCWNRENTWVWNIAPAAWSAIINLTRLHPELELKLVDAYVETEAERYDAVPDSRRVAITPGRFVRFSRQEQQRARLPRQQLEVVSSRGGKVRCVKYRNGQWGFEIDGKPTLIRGVSFPAAKTGTNYDWNWMTADENANGLNDVAYETWVDANRNNERDADEPVVGDFQLLHEMGANAIRLFNDRTFDAKLLRDMHARFGIGAFICEPLGAYTVHSDAEWNEGTDYTDAQQRQRMIKAVEDMVRAYRDQPWLLGYILGNENNMSADYSGVNATRTQASRQPQAYAEFLNEIAELIHRLDPEHPVGVGNVGLKLIDAYAKFAPALDFLGINEYPGADGFGCLWQKAKRLFDRPVLITEFGCDAYATGKGPDEASQERYHRQNWGDIVYNSAGEPGEGNCIGGIVFQWADEWWKDTRGDPRDKQNIEPTFEMAFPDGWSQEEWLGIIGQGDGRHSPFLRQPRQAYYMYKTLWNRAVGEGEK